MIVRSSRRIVSAAGVAGSALIALIALAACTSSTNGTGTVAGAKQPTNTATPTTSAPASPTPTPTPTPTITRVAVHVSVNVADNATVGVGMPYIAAFSQTITDARAFQAATKVTVDGKPVDARWFFEHTDPSNGHVLEAHLRTEKYWPAHASIHVDLPLKGVRAGKVPGQPHSVYVFDNGLTSDFATGDARVGTVDNATHTLTVRDDGKVWGTFPVSLGAPKTPTRHGIKVIMEKVPTVCMHDTGGHYYECGIKNDQRLTYDGEYLHAAPWNTYNIDHGVNSSNGCTNLHPADAVKLYGFLQIGDPIEYPNADGKQMQLGDGYGDWNVTWTMWKTGGVVRTV